MRLTGKKVVVTGGARGIGEATVRAYVREGATVASLDVLDDLGSQVAEEAARNGPGSARYYHCDVARRQSVEAVMGDAVGHLGGLDVLANIAGVERSSPAEDITDAEWDLVLGVNVAGTMLTNQVACRSMEGGGGSIINVGSDAGLGPYPNGAHYSASKGAVMAWTRTVAVEWARFGIRVNSLVPAIWTPMYDEYRARLSAGELADHDAGMQARVPLGGKLGDPDGDLAPVMVFLASDESRFITGQIVSVNGGIGMVR
jgi:NAD(P)-dependent dehydrogenase (short-subunit alcohol dehydrogenase family)